MKDLYPQVGIEALCGLFGKTRYAFYDTNYRRKDNLLRDEIILQLVSEIRCSLPRLGVRKLYHLIKPKTAEHHFDVGRDYLFELLAKNKMLVRTRKRKIQTTYSNHWMRKYTNLIKDLQLNRPEQLWVSDITYIRCATGFAYLSLITDAYSKKILGYNLRKDLSSEGCIDALKKALQGRSPFTQSLIHHSDRGVQYCCSAYVDLLLEHSIAISMTDGGDPYENAIAERVNGILKTEFNLYSTQQSFEKTILIVEESITAYNQFRPHASLNYLTPDEAHKINGPLKRKWKNYTKSKQPKTDTFEKSPTCIASLGLPNPAV